MKDDLQLFKDQFYDDLAASDDVRDAANEEFRFTSVAGGQWEGFLEDAYENRAKPELDHVSDYVRRIESRWRHNRRMVNYVPSDEATTDDQADLMDGLIRRDMERSGGQDAIDTAVGEMLRCGYGCVLLNTEYEDEGDPDNEAQNVVFTEIPNAYSTVVWDASARRADKADAKHVTVLSAHSIREYEDRYPDMPLSNLEPQNRSFFNWYLSKADLVYVATRYHIESVSMILHTFHNPEKVDDAMFHVKDSDLTDEKRDELASFGYKWLRKRRVKKQKVIRTVFSGHDILEPSRQITGDHIPVIPMYATRSIVDGSEYYQGVVREKMDGQRLLNMSFGLASESAAHASDDKLIFNPEQVANPDIRNQWARNWHQQPYLVVDSVKDSSGNPVALGAVDKIAGTNISPALGNLIQMVRDSMTVATGGAPQDIIDPNASGKAINAMMKRVDLNVDYIFDNIDKFLKRLGVVYASIAREVYSAIPNRSVRIMRDQGGSEMVSLQSIMGEGGQLSLVNDLNKGRFEVSVSTSPDFASEKEETFEALKDIVALMAPDDPMRSTAVRLLVLQKEGVPSDAKDAIRRELLMSGVLRPENEKEQMFLQQMQEAQQNQGMDPNTQLMLSMAAEQQTQAKMNEASIADKLASAAKKAAEAEEVKIDSYIKTKQIKDADKLMEQAAAF